MALIMVVREITVGSPRREEEKKEEKEKAVVVGPGIINIPTPGLQLTPKRGYWEWEEMAVWVGDTIPLAPVSTLTALELASTVAQAAALAYTTTMTLVEKEEQQRPHLVGLRPLSSIRMWLTSRWRRRCKGREAYL